MIYPKTAPNIREPVSLFTGPFSATLWPRAARAKGPSQGKAKLYAIITFHSTGERWPKEFSYLAPSVHGFNRCSDVASTRPFVKPARLHFARTARALTGRCVSEASCPNFQPRAHAGLTGLTTAHQGREPDQRLKCYHLDTLQTLTLNLILGLGAC